MEEASVERVESGGGNLGNSTFRLTVAVDVRHENGFYG